jgi:hypothetical protein
MNRKEELEVKKITLLLLDWRGGKVLQRKE